MSKQNAFTSIPDFSAPSLLIARPAGCSRRTDNEIIPRLSAALARVSFSLTHLLHGPTHPDVRVSAEGSYEEVWMLRLISAGGVMA